MALIIALCIVAAIVAAVAINADEPAAPVMGEQGERVMAIEDYVRLNISEISPVQEVLGGTFYVTDIEADNGAGTVSYEDGHSAYTGDFTYSSGEYGAWSIDSFELRE